MTNLLYNSSSTKVEPQHEESRCRLPQGDGRERHGEHLPRGKELAQEERHVKHEESRL